MTQTSGDPPTSGVEYKIIPLVEETRAASAFTHLQQLAAGVAQFRLSSLTTAHAASAQHWLDSHYHVIARIVSRSVTI